MKLFDSEWKVMDELWENGDLSAKELSQRLNSCNAIKLSKKVSIKRKKSLTRGEKCAAKS